MYRISARIIERYDLGRRATIKFRRVSVRRGRFRLYLVFDVFRFQPRDMEMDGIYFVIGMWVSSWILYLVRVTYL